jgi:16S rRNA (cytidine1402-2'-O)-methyltransferase
VLADQQVEARSVGPGLYIVATPIGNLRDITLRALETLAAADVIACEDTRVTRKLVSHYGISTPLVAYHEHNAAEARPKILARLSAGETVALVSDAGTPLISDPGYKLVVAVRAAGHAVTAVPGASSILAAVAVAGLPTDRFTFEGFLPPKQQARRNRIAALAGIPSTLVLFESGPRLADSLADLATELGPRDAAVCRELTKLHEEVRRGPLPALAQAYAQEPAPRGEMVIVIGPPVAQQPASADQVSELLQRALERGTLKDAVKEVATITGRPRAEVYRQALALAEKGADAGE